MTALEVRGLSKTFGGLRALDQVDLEAPPASILSIIGPNGSGKTTLFNCISGIYRADAGTAWLRGQGWSVSLDGLRPDQVTRAGLARTFQSIRLFPRMTVLENVLVGMHGAMEGGLTRVLLRSSRFRAVEQDARHRAQEFLQFFGDQLASRSESLACSLSYANQRRLEIARAMATGASVLLLDEPAAGMNPTETASLMEDIVRIRNRGRTILLIEHDMAVIAGISDAVLALESGRKIAHGSFSEVRSDPRVIEAYLGRGSAGRSGDSAGPGEQDG